MKKLSKGTIGIIVLAVVAVLWVMSKYNTMVTKQEAVETAWGNVQNEYQRRLDLIPGLLNSVKAAAKHETDIFDKLAQARQAASTIKIDAADLTEENLAKFQAAQGEISNLMSRLMAIAEDTPELKANENFLKYMDQYEGTENRIRTARERFNESAQDYNTYIRKFPANICASIFGFEKRPYFQAEAGAEKAPDTASMWGKMVED